MVAIVTLISPLSSCFLSVPILSLVKTPQRWLWKDGHILKFLVRMNLGKYYSNPCNSHRDMRQASAKKHPFNSSTTALVQ